MNVRTIKRATEAFVKSNSTTILTVIGVTGTITTAVLAGKASFKAAEVIRLEESRGGTHGDTLPRAKERFKLIWQLYIPAVASGVGTVACIICANRLGTRKTAALAAAYSLSEKGFSEYKDKVVETIGKTKEADIRTQVAQDRVNNLGERVVIMPSQDGLVLCHDAYSNQFFHSDMETIRSAVNTINAQILHADFATVSDLYHEINSPELEDTSFSTQFGWNTDRTLMVNFDTVLYKDKVPCLSFEFATAPVADPWRYS